MKTIVWANHKGGCAKTTCALNVAVTLAATGSRVLAVDLDFQGNLSAAMGVDLYELESSQKTSHRLMLDERADFSDYAVKVRPRIDLIPTCFDDDAEALLEGQSVSRELLLREKLLPARSVYDYCVIDTPPSLRVPTLNALAMAQLTVVPVETSYFALIGFNQLLRKIYRVRKAHSPAMIVMALSSRYVQRQTLDKEIRGKVLERMTEDFVFSTTIPRANAVVEAISQLQAIVEVAPESAASFAFRQLVNEIREVLGDEESRSLEARQRAK